MVWLSKDIALLCVYDAPLRTKSHFRHIGPNKQLQKTDERLKLQTKLQQSTNGKQWSLVERSNDGVI
jgi:hypothetical protein